VHADLLPVTLNYRLQGGLQGAFGYYAGAGAGFARTRLDGASINGPVRLSDNSFAAQAFAGVTYQASPTITLNLGAKYIWIDEVKFGGTRFEVDDDVAFSAGISLKF
jgi:opacity protein-like surface antigen